MAKIDTSNWGEFKIGDIFDVYNGKKYIKNERIPGELPIVTNTTKNNGEEVGIKERTDGVYKNFISVAYGSGTGMAFYHKNKCFVGETVMALVPKGGITLNHLTGVFISTILTQFGKLTYTYGKKPKVSEYRNKVTIPLPQTPEGTPDWAYMEAYMEQIRKRIDDTVTTLEKVESPNKPIDTSQWGDFKIRDLFEIVGSKTTPKYQLDLLDRPNKKSKYPYVTTSATNNGVAGYSDKWTEKGNVLTVDSAVIGYVAYQSQNFTASDHVEVLKPKFPMSEYIGLYVAAIMNQKGKQIGYQYNHKRSQKALRSESIPLPQTTTGEPDWAYMEAYMDNVRKHIDQKVTALEGLN